MAKPRRTGAETSETRLLLLDVTEKVMLEDGYAAVSSRRIAKGADVTPALVHYYFETLDDLFLAVLRRRAEQQLELQRRLLSTSQQPLRALWEATKDPARTGLMLEFMSLANHRKVIRSELAAHAEQFRKVQLESLRDYIERCGLADDVSPLAAVVLINSIAQTVVLEQSIGMEMGLAETTALVERYLEKIEDSTN